MQSPAPTKWASLLAMVIVGLAVGFGVVMLTSKERMPTLTQGEQQEVGRRAAEALSAVLPAIEMHSSDAESHDVEPSGVETQPSSGAAEAVTVATKETDAEWLSFPRAETDSMALLASTNSPLDGRDLFRAQDLNPSDKYVEPRDRDELWSIIKKYKELFAGIDKSLADASLKEADMLRAKGVLPRTDRIILTDEEKRSVNQAGDSAVRRLRRRDPEATEEKVQRARTRGEAEEMMRIKGANIMLANPDGTYTLAASDGLETTKAAEKDPGIAFLRIERAMDVVRWFQRQGALGDNAAAALLEHYYRSCATDVSYK